MAETTTGFKQFWNGLKSIGEGPGRQIYQLPTAGAGQQALQYPLLAKALGNLVQGRNTEAFNPIEQNTMRQFHQETIPSIAQRFAGDSNTAASSGFAGELAGAAGNLHSQLASERAKFGQEEERLRQSGLDQLLKFAYLPTHENVLMPEPTGNVPKTVDQQLIDTLYPSEANIQWAKEQASNIGRGAINKGKELLERGKGAVGLGSGRRGEAQVPIDKLAGSEVASALAKANPTNKRMLDEIIETAGGYPANQFASLRNPKTAITEGGLRRLNFLANKPAFKNTTDTTVKQALLNLRNEKEIEDMIKFVEMGNVNYIPKSVRQGNDYWKKVYNRAIKNIPGINEGKK
jgi:hypothetical protein